ncbi:hypothetical protein BpHYR1_052639 [Brachionus plicatilis]|uniref:Uncharacterized protein n=1 Tax=Brachionus plicatilis TaxID=10195 RepID=A0A3M7S9G7_BRAPC|nr:hypothetical protein BpHYR1_052639 [Brachionus plicatilis]
MIHVLVKLSNPVKREIFNFLSEILVLGKAKQIFQNYVNVLSLRVISHSNVLNHPKNTLKNSIIILEIIFIKRKQY